MVKILKTIDVFDNDVKIAEKIYYERENKSVGIKYKNILESKTQQHQKDECDINNIVRKYSANEIFNKFVYDVNNDNIVDVSEIPDYPEALVKVTQAQQQFDNLPSKLRKFFNNDPSNMVQYCSNPENLEGMYKLGLAVKPQNIEPNVQNDVSNGNEPQGE